MCLEHATVYMYMIIHIHAVAFSRRNMYQFCLNCPVALVYIHVCVCKLPRFTHNLLRQRYPEKLYTFSAIRVYMYFRYSRSWREERQRIRDRERRGRRRWRGRKRKWDRSAILYYRQCRLVTCVYIHVHVPTAQMYLYVLFVILIPVVVLIHLHCTSVYIALPIVLGQWQWF